MTSRQFNAPTHLPAALATTTDRHRPLVGAAFATASIALVGGARIENAGSSRAADTPTGPSRIISPPGSTAERRDMAGTFDIRGRTAIDLGVATLADVLARHSVAALRVSLGLVFLGFGALKFFPGASPAEDLAIATVDKLTLGVVGGGGALRLTAVVECLIGLTLVTGRLLKAGLALLAAAMVGIMSPLVFFFGDLFPGGQPTIEGQYVLKDIILVTAASVVAARVLGARFVTGQDA